MLKIPDALRDIVNENPFFEFGISYRLFNLSQLSKFIQPLVTARTQKEAQTSAILMGLSRLQRETEKKVPQSESFKIENISIYSSLCTMTFFKADDIHEKLNQVHNSIRIKNGLFSLTESTTEITIFFERQFINIIKKHISAKPKFINDNISCVSVRFLEKFLKIPGLLTMLMQKITLQNVNLIEISSTCTECNFYIEQKDVKLVFETLHDCFLR